MSRLPKIKIKLIKKKNDSFINGMSELLPETISANIVPKFKYCQVTSIDVERSFSTFKNILTNQKHNLSTENLEQYLIVNICMSTKY